MSGLDVRDVGLWVVRPTLAALAVAAPGIDGPIAEALLLATAAQESQFRRLHQIGGPAVGLWQMEPVTERDLVHWLAGAGGGDRPALWQAVRRMLGNGGDASDLAWNLRYACAMARLLYWRSPMKLAPAATASSLWPIYKAVYNTEKGSATQEEFTRNYLTLVAPFWPPPA